MKDYAGKFMKKKLLIIIPIVVILMAIVAIKVLVRPVESSSVNKLRSLPYLNWVSAEKGMNKSGVTIYEKGRAFEGINIYVPRDRLAAYLLIG